MSDKNSIDLGGEGQSFAFDEIGDRVVGKIVSFEQLQQTDLETNEPAFWPGGQPKTMVRVDLKTKLSDDPTDDGMRSVYLRGSKKASSRSAMAAVLTAMKDATGGTTLQVGAVLALEFVDEDAPKKRGWNGAKKYEAVYKAPTVQLGDEDERPARKSRAVSASSASVDDFDDPDDRGPVTKRLDRSRQRDEDDFDDEPAPRKRRRAPIDDEDEPAPRARRRPAPVDEEGFAEERPARRPRSRPPIDDDFDEDELKV